MSRETSQRRSTSPDSLVNGAESTSELTYAQQIEYLRGRSDCTQFAGQEECAAAIDPRPAERIRDSQSRGRYRPTCATIRESPESSSSDVTIIADTQKSSEYVDMNATTNQETIYLKSPFKQPHSALTVVHGQVSLHVKHHPALDSLPRDILREILQHVFPVSDTVTPWFQAGRLIIGVRGWSKNDSGVTFNPNIDATFLRLNKACHQVGTDLLYGSNHFRFAHRPDCCKWWLKLIGNDSLKKIRMMTFEMNSGWLDDRRRADIIPDPSDCTHEELWAKAIHYVAKQKLTLHYLNITTMMWVDTWFETGYDLDEREEIDKYRRLIIDVLGEIRNVERVQIGYCGPAWMSHHEVAAIEMSMKQRVSTARSPSPPRLSLAQVMEQVQAQKQIEQFREARRQQQRLEQLQLEQRQQEDGLRKMFHAQHYGG